MKNMKYLIILAVLITVLQSCKKDFLEVKQQGEQSYNTYFANGTQVEALVNGIYTVLQWDKVHGQLDWVYGDVMSDDTEKGGSDDSDQPEMRQMEIYNHNSNNAYIGETWSNLYTGIFRANMVLKRIDDVPQDVFPNAYKERLRAEAKFLRAYFYFRLNIMWGGVPLITDVLEPNEFIQERASKEAVWAQIEKDLTEAASFLPKKGLNLSTGLYIKDEAKNYDPAKDLGRATSGAANSLLCKVYLYQQKWSQARAQADIVIGSGDYDLTTLSGTTTFVNIFDIEHENKNESIFEVQCGGGEGNYVDADYGYGWGNADVGTLMNVYWLSRDHGGWGFNCPTQNLFDEFEGAEIRRDATIAKHGDNLFYGILAYNTNASPTKYYPEKYIVSSDMITKAKSLSQGPSNFRIIRYADILLMHAEACAQMGDSALAITSVMKVRNRAKLTTMAPNKVKTLVPGTGKVVNGVFIKPQYTYFEIGPSLLDKIYHERRVELACEGHRFFDLVRWGLAEQKLGPLGYTSKNAVFPIPEGEIQLSGGKLVQNPGY